MVIQSQHASAQMDDLAVWANYLNGNSPTETTPTKEEPTAGEGKPHIEPAAEETPKAKKAGTPLQRRAHNKRLAVLEKLAVENIPLPARPRPAPKQKPPPPAGQILPREVVLVPAQQIKFVVPKGCDIVFIREK